MAQRGTAEQVWRTWTELVVAAAATTHSGAGPAFVSTSVLASAHGPLEDGRDLGAGTLAALPAHHDKHSGDDAYSGYGLIQRAGGSRSRVFMKVVDVDAARAAFPGASLPEGAVAERHWSKGVSVFMPWEPEVPPDALPVEPASGPPGGSSPGDQTPEMAFDPPGVRPGRSEPDLGEESFDDVAFADRLAMIKHLGRGSAQHETTIDRLLAELAECSPQVGRPGHQLVPDLRWDCVLGRAVAEVKTCGTASVAAQLRLGLGQVLEYRTALAAADSDIGTPAVGVLFCDFPPPKYWYGVCASAGVRLVGPGDDLGPLAEPLP